MNNTENPGTSSWTRIQGGVRDTERLIGQKKYNMAMVKARQTLEFMVKCLCERTGVLEGNLIDMIDALYEEKVISKTTFEHYHRIRTIGNKAIHEEDNSAYNANQAYHLLSQEVYTFANDYSDRKKRPAASASARRSDNTPSRRPAAKSSGSSSSRRRRARSSGPSIDIASLIKPLLLIAIIVVLVFIIKMIHPTKTKPAESTAPISTEQTTGIPETAPETEVPSTETPAAVKYKTTDTVNLRSDPSTNNARIAVLAPDTEVEYVEGSEQTDSQGRTWCTIKYNGQDAYLVKDYITQVTQ